MVAAKAHAIAENIMKLVRFDAVRSAEPPNISGSPGASRSSTSCEAWRVATEPVTPASSSAASVTLAA